MEKNNTYPNLGKNIRALRKSFGKSLNQMADDLATAGDSDKRFDENYRFIQKQTISQYENGKRIPEREYLNIIAKYFKVTVDELLYGDFTNLKFNIEDLNNKEINIKYFNSLFPITFTEKALENDKFKQAYTIHKKVFNYFTNQTTDYKESDIDKLKTLYESAYREDKIIESIYNLLSWTMFEDYIYSILTPSNLEKIDIDDNISSSEFLEMLYLNKPELEPEDVEKNEIFKKELKEYLEKQDITFYTYITILKKKNKYTDFADFYIALRYILGLFSDNNYETNRLIGTSLLNTLDYIGNDYIRKLKLINKKIK